MNYGLISTFIIHIKKPKINNKRKTSKNKYKSQILLMDDFFQLVTH
jgi:hypothetical protein